MAVQNFVGDGFRGATWIGLHNGGGVGWGEVMNVGWHAHRRKQARAPPAFHAALGRQQRHCASELGQNKGAWAIDRAMEMEPRLKVTRANRADDDLIAAALS